MNIPAQFTLGGYTITVEYSNEVLFVDDKIGLANMREQKVVILKDGENYRMTKEQIEHTFCHELVHWILFMMKSKKVNDEEFVDLFATFLHQALITAKHA